MKPYSWGLRPQAPCPDFSNFMKRNRDIIRWFIQQVDWVVPSNLAYLIYGRCDRKLERTYASELSEMLKVKDSSLRLRKIVNQDGKHAYTRYAKVLPTFSFNHDCALRNVIGKFLKVRDVDEAQEVSLERPSDASILHYRLELDNGHMDQTQLREKILKHYMFGNIQVVFIMRSLYSESSEEARLKKIFDISQDLFYDQPNRILGACYLKYLENGKIYNRKGDER